MFSRYFLRIIRQSIQMVCPVFSRVVSFRRVEGPNRTLVSKTSATCSHGPQTASGNQQGILGWLYFSDEFPLGKQTCLSRQLQFPPGKQTRLSRQQQFPPGKQTCFSRQQQFQTLHLEFLVISLNYLITIGPFIREKIRRVLNKTRADRINGTK